MEEIVTKEDLRQFGLFLFDKLRMIIQETNVTHTESLPPEWIKTRSVRKMLDISAASIQNLRVTQKVRYKKVLGSYYYNMEDLQKLFSDESNP